MAATQLQNKSTDVMESDSRTMSERVAEQVSEILEVASQPKQAPRPAMVYSVPAPGVRYYF